MFVFLMALKHPDTSNDYANVERLLITTLHSVSKQTSQEYRVVVVCNRLPEIDLDDQRIHFHVVDFPPVTRTNGVLDKKEKFTDKGTKYFSGLMYAKQFNPSYVYILDSDDYVNCKLVETMQSLPSNPVWYVDSGCFVNMETKEYKKRRGLLRYCGSTFIYQYDYLLKVAKPTKAIDAESSQQMLIDATSEFFVIDLLSNHLINYNHYKKLGANPKPIPLCAACWVQGTGENVSRTAGGDDGLPIDGQFINDFGLPESLLNDRSKTLKDSLRDLIAVSKSFFTWQYSKLSGKRIF